MKRVLVTGASGFIGRHCLQPLVDRGYEVHAVAREPLRLSTAITWHRADLLEDGTAAALARSVAASHLLHFAWCASPADYLSNPANRRWAAVTLELAEAFAAAGGARFVGAGSCAEYASSLSSLVEDTTPLGPTSLYGESKIIAYRQIAARAETANLSFAWGRTFFPYGPYQARARLIASVITALLQRRAPPSSMGVQERDFIHVCDVAGAFLAILDSDLTGPCNIGSGRPISVRAIVTLIARLMACEDLLRPCVPPQRTGEPAFIVADIRRLRDELGWHPQLTLEGGLTQTIGWWRSRVHG
ncbi:MAG TPA: NAD(P)-dependent oxidoreductase [Candidatus Binataceae bacterium]|nr:NAD(P)-dependent oxidoreductase [Candidatus Binataceae bacterium]